MGVTRVVGAKSTSQAGRALWVIGSLLLAAVAVVPCAYAAHAAWGAISALVAWATCLCGGLLALWLVHLCRGPQNSNVVSPVLLGMLARMGVPLLVCLIVYVPGGPLGEPLGGPLAQAGFVYYLLAFYFVTLIIETVLLSRAGQPQVMERPTV